ncbi:SAM-dependent methyltransferase [Nocardia sp. NBC_00565]|uniref:SAM-dependent methyltransferase n=1 Tax=Nocardia sp. NBC_00565 TaxID=2975993 RepID=UPI002E81DA12|nr:SAM-dependent methyltransferase [Nocardia sp. NBC_00565]WUB99928.1 SAM-dependent methyltransferase [Nocardia sp. NBC_00565]
MVNARPVSLHRSIDLSRQTACHRTPPDSARRRGIPKPAGRGAPVVGFRRQPVEVRDNYEADQVFAQRILQVAPDSRALAKMSRRFLLQGVRTAAESGVRQFIDIGAGGSAIDLFGVAAP